MRKVMVYWNLHKGLYSIKDLTGPNRGRVTDRQEDVLLKDVVGRVSEAGRQRVLREDRKNVHAGLVGYLMELDYDLATSLEWIGDSITYNPRKYDSFVHTVDGSKFQGSAYAFMTGTRKVFVA